MSETTLATGIAATAALARDFKARVLRPAPVLCLDCVRPLIPIRGLAWSTALHMSALSAALWLQWYIVNLDPPLIPVASGEYVELTRTAILTIPGDLKQVTGSKGSSTDPSAGKSGATLAPSRQCCKTPHLSAPKDVPSYAGKQEVLSIASDATNNVQTIRRPDLVAPKKLKFPELLQSLIVTRPASTPTLEQKEQDPQAAVTAREVINVKQSLTVPRSVSKGEDAKAPKLAAVKTPKATVVENRPAAMPLLRPEVTTVSSKSAVIISAVAVPESAPTQIPDAELAASFVIHAGAATPGSSAAATTRGVGSTTASDAPAASNGGKSESAGGGGNSTSHAPASGSGSGTANHGDGSGSGSATAKNGAGSGSGDTGVGIGGSGTSGIAILGGTGRGGRAFATPARSARVGYAMTIISNGASGGAARDSGVFARNETVYTVYIDMSTAGGGPEWPMQYALSGATQSGNSMLQPPVAQTKIQARWRSDPNGNFQKRIFVAGVISESGEVSGLHAVAENGPQAQAAIDVLRNWKFLPAQLDARPVGSKFLIGVSFVLDPN